MIQLNTSAPSGSQDSSANPFSSTASQTDGGFQSALSSALSATLQQFGINPNSVTLSITPATAAATTSTTASATTGAAAVTPFSAASTAANAVSATPAASSTAATTAETTPSAPSATSAAEASSSVESDESYDNAYWASQPSAVQALRNIDDYSQRSELAAKLSAEGYDIDVPIMVYGWDPAKITAARESYGYTWVPSAAQTPVEQAPGISTPGGTAYNANNPPAGSIAV
jgi:hypothetical protein